MAVGRQRNECELSAHEVQRPSRPSPRCSGRCQHGHFSTSPCRECCRKAKNHDGAHDCLRHERTPKLPPPVPRVRQGATPRLGSRAVMLTTPLRSPPSLRSKDTTSREHATGGTVHASGRLACAKCGGGAVLFECPTCGMGVCRPCSSTCGRCNVDNISY